VVGVGASRAIGPSWTVKTVTRCPSKLIVLNF
jgi:hypothetical protein